MEYVLVVIFLVAFAGTYIKLQKVRSTLTVDPENVDANREQLIFFILALGCSVALLAVSTIVLFPHSDIGSSIGSLAAALCTTAAGFKVYYKILDWYDWEVHRPQRQAEQQKQQAEAKAAAEAKKKAADQAAEQERLKAAQQEYNTRQLLRFEHTHIVAGSGHGKSQLLQSMIIDDVDRDCAVVVIDSQGDMIHKLATRIPAEQVVLVDPELTPPALNLFSATDTAAAIELYEYIFSALDSAMTAKQQTVYRYVCRLLLTIPSATIHTMRQVLEPDGLYQYQDYIAQLPETAQAFFANEYQTREYKETKQQILRRLYTVLENTTMEQMLGSVGTFSIKEHLDAGKVVLISTAKSYLKHMGASLFGRIFIAQVMQAVMGETNRKPTYLYIDEFQDYAEDSHVLLNLFEQARKYKLGMVVAHQYLGQLPPKLQQSLAANTAIKYVGGVSIDDARKLSTQIDITPGFIQHMPKGSFVAWYRGLDTIRYDVTLGRLEHMPELQPYQSFAAPAPVVEIKKVAEPTTSYNVDEKGEWS